MTMPGRGKRLETMVQDGIQVPVRRSRLAETELDMTGSTAAELESSLNQPFAP
jgi:hypothetical protein